MAVTTGRATWQGDSSRAVSSHASNRTPADANHLLLTVAGEANSSNLPMVASTGQDLDQGRLPRAPHHAVIIPPDDARSIYVCNDAGVYHSPDFGQTWTNLSRNLPHVMVVDLVYHQGTSTTSGHLWPQPLAAPGGSANCLCAFG